MNITKTAIEGVVIIEPKLFNDSRGYFFESYNKKAFDEEVAKVDFVQDNESCSTRGVMRGLHFQLPIHSGQTCEMRGRTCARCRPGPS